MLEGTLRVTGVEAALKNAEMKAAIAAVARAAAAQAQALGAGATAIAIAAAAATRTAEFASKKTRGKRAVKLARVRHLAANPARDAIVAAAIAADASVAAGAPVAATATAATAAAAVPADAITVHTAASFVVTNHARGAVALTGMAQWELDAVSAAVIAAAAGVPAVGITRAAAPLVFETVTDAVAIEDNALTPIVAAAVLAAPLLARPALRPVLDHAVSHGAAEKYVLLTGDADFSNVRSQALNPPPLVVALTAVHHGAITELGGNHEHIPWAPGSDAVKAATAAIQCTADGGSVVAVALAAAVALDPAAVAAGPTAAQISLAARSAVAGNNTAQVTTALGNAALGPLATSACNAVATAQLRAGQAAATMRSAVAAGAVVAGSEAAMAGACVAAVQAQVAGAGGSAAERRLAVAAAALLGTYLGPTLPASLCGATAFAAAQAALAAPLGPAALAGLIAPLPDQKLATLVPVLPPAVTAATAPAATLDAELAAAIVVGGAVGGTGSMEDAVLAMLREWNSTTGAAVAGALRKIMIAAPGGVANPLSAGAAPLGVPGAAWTARNWAASAGAASGAAEALNVSAPLVDAAVNAARSGAAVPNFGAMPASGKIAYSYGVARADGHHYYLAAPGAKGHPHPAAVALYESHGWTERRNTAQLAHASQQPDAASPHGHVALGWDQGIPGPLAAPLQAGCPNCQPHAFLV
ncbi:MULTISPECIES: hypothetical protein [Sorangium]|uniref:Uncharacterized protein n=1 Tax=Sorangium cellulosum TaxID=56 RepID=A0A4P2QMA8_SORCE|nr:MULTISPECIES: hypothetical protein [Sorangium]AUX31204.1 uncharacterized protein SOCE836_033320 [Sorangium cellulosum]WCQ90586.1 hypothetical protein NQZ70_03297 [Sorangium sp. Soce836]